MNDIQNLLGQEAIAKIKEMAMDIQTCMFCTELGSVPFHTRPMSTRDVDDLGNIWFLSSASSDKNQEIKQDSAVQLIYVDSANFNYLSIYGVAEIYKDKEKIKDLWTPIAKAWFKEGADDPDASVICIKPREGYYWDTLSGKIVSMVKIAFSAITGKETEENIEGTLQVQ